MKLLVQEPFRYRFLDVTSSVVSEEQVGMPSPVKDIFVRDIAKF